MITLIRDYAYILVFLKNFALVRVGLKHSYIEKYPIKDDLTVFLVEAYKLNQRIYISVPILPFLPEELIKVSYESDEAYVKFENVPVLLAESNYGPVGLFAKARRIDDADDQDEHETKLNQINLIKTYPIDKDHDKVEVKLGQVHDKNMSP